MKTVIPDPMNFVVNDKKDGAVGSSRPISHGRFNYIPVESTALIKYRGS
jgi:hypothetical protein